MVSRSGFDMLYISKMCSFNTDVKGGYLSCITFSVTSCNVLFALLDDSAKSL